jgi:hypothetical protein
MIPKEFRQVLALEAEEPLADYDRRQENGEDFWQGQEDELKKAAQSRGFFCPGRRSLSRKILTPPPAAGAGQCPLCPLPEPEQGGAGPAAADQDQCRSSPLL